MVEKYFFIEKTFFYFFIFLFPVTLLAGSESFWYLFIISLSIFFLGGLTFERSRKSFFDDSLFKVMAVWFILIAIVLVIFHYESIFTYKFENIFGVSLLVFSIHYFEKYRFKPSHLLLMLVVLTFAFLWLQFGNDRYVALRHIFKQANAFGMLMVVASLATFYLILEFYKKSSILFTISIIVFLILSYGVFFSWSRGSFLAYLVGLIYLVFNLSFKNKVTWLVIYLLMISVLIYADVGGITSKLELAYQNIIQFNEGQTQTSVGYRFEMWLLSLNIFLENYLVGIGFLNFSDYWVEYASTEGLNAYFNQTHNGYIEILVELGFAGVLIYSFLFYSLFYHFKKLKNNNAKTVLFSILIAFMVGLLFDSLFNHKKYLYFMFLIIYFLYFFGKENSTLSQEKI